MPADQPHPAPPMWSISGAELVLPAVGLAPPGVVRIAAPVPLRLPLGAFYWDAAVYLDAFQRIHIGQMPAVDLFAPV